MRCIPSFRLETREKADQTNQVTQPRKNCCKCWDGEKKCKKENQTFSSILSHFSTGTVGAAVGTGVLWEAESELNLDHPSYTFNSVFA